MIALVVMILALLVGAAQAQGLTDLDRQIQSRQQALEELTRKEKDLKEELYRYSQAIEEKWAQIQNLKQKIAEKEEAIKECQDRQKKLESELTGLKKRLKLRLKTYYRLGPVGFLNLLLSSEDIGVLLARERLFEMALLADRRLAQRYQNRLLALRDNERQLLKEKSDLEVLTRDLRQELVHLESLREAKMALLEAIREKKELYKDLLQEILLAQKDLARIIRQIKSLEDQPFPPSKPIKKEDFPAYPLWPPVRGSHPVKYEEGPGIFFEATIGDPIYAPAGGEVIYLGVKKAFGEVIIIEHPKGLRSIIAGGGAYYKKVGDLVKRGELIGRVGAGGLGKEGVYYELRLGAIPLLPLEWLDKTFFQ